MVNAAFVVRNIQQQVDVLNPALPVMFIHQLVFTAKRYKLNHRSGIVVFLLEGNLSAAHCKNEQEHGYGEK